MIFYKISFQHSQQLRGHRQEYVDTFGKLKTYKEGLSQILIDSQLKKGSWVCLHTQTQKFKNMKKFVSKEKFVCRHSLWLRGHQIFLLCDQVCETVFACLYGVQIESFKQKNDWKPRHTVSFKLTIFQYWTYKNILNLQL